MLHSSHIGPVVQSYAKDFDVLKQKHDILLDQSERYATELSNLNAVLEDFSHKKQVAPPFLLLYFRSQPASLTVGLVCSGVQQAEEMLKRYQQQHEAEKEAMRKTAEDMRALREQLTQKEVCYRASFFVDHHVPFRPIQPSRRSSFSVINLI